MGRRSPPPGHREGGAPGARRRPRHPRRARGRGPRARRPAPSEPGARLRRRARRAPAAPRAGVPRGPARVDVHPAGGRGRRAGALPRPAAGGGAALRRPARMGAPRREAAQRDHGGAPAADRPERRPHRRAGPARSGPDRHRRLHGARAVRSGAGGRDRPAGRRVGPRGDGPRACGRAPRVPGARPRRRVPPRALSAARRRPLPLPSGTPAHLAAAIHACLERRPGDRPTAAELAADLEPIVDALPRPRLGMLRPGGRRRFQRLG